MFYHYHQNNSGGATTGPAVSFVIEADSADQADSIAESLGVYFDGCDNEVDCPCCGDRWSRANNFDEHDTPDCYYNGAFWETKGLPLARIVYANGSIEDRMT